MQMAAPKPQRTGELFHVCFPPYLSPTALCWVSVTPAPKACWLLTPGDRCGELRALAVLLETRHSRRDHTLLKPQIHSNKRPNWEDILAFSLQSRRGSHDHLPPCSPSLGAGAARAVPAKARWVGRLCFPCLCLVSAASHLP